MSFIAHKMTYTKELVKHSNIDCISFEEKYFLDYMNIYNECFYDMRKALDRKP